MTVSLLLLYLTFAAAAPYKQVRSSKFLQKLLVPFSPFLKGPIASTPIMGWSSWCTETPGIPCYADYCSESEILDIAKFMSSSGLLELGYQWILLDDCWAGQQRATDGSITEDLKRFPSGMRNFTAQLHSMGFKLGLYTDVGPKTCRGGRLGSWPHYQQDANTFALDWQIDEVKMDWCGHPAGFTAQELYTNFSNALRATGRDVYFSICEWGLFEPWTWAPAIANSWRTGPDHIPVWNMSSGCTQTPGKCGGTANIIEQMAGLSRFTSPQHFNDPDYIEIEWYNFGSKEIETQISFWALTAAPFVFANDPRKTHVNSYMKNKALIAISQDPLVRAGDRRQVGFFGYETWSRQLVSNQWAVLMYNSQVHEVLGLKLYGSFYLNSTYLTGWSDTPGTTFLLHDVWRNADLGTMQQQQLFTTAKKLEPRESMLVLVMMQ